jgi:cell division protein FtsQ
MSNNGKHIQEKNIQNKKINKYNGREQKKSKEDSKNNHYNEDIVSDRITDMFMEKEHEFNKKRKKKKENNKNKKENIEQEENVIFVNAIIREPEKTKSKKQHKNNIKKDNYTHRVEDRKKNIQTNKNKERKKYSNKNFNARLDKNKINDEFCDFEDRTIKNKRRDNNKKTNQKNLNRTTQNKTNKNNNEAQNYQTRKKTKKEIEKDKRIKKMKIIKKILKLLILIALVAIAFIYISTSPFFNITEIELSGNSRFSQSTYINLANIPLNTNIFNFRKSEIISNLKQNAYVENVVIRRIIPNKVKIEIEERTVDFTVKISETEYIYINKNGYILEKNVNENKTVILKGISTDIENIVEGQQLNENDIEKINDVIKIQNAMKNNEIQESFDEIDVSSKYDYILKFENEAKEVYIGDTNDLNTKMMFMKYIINEQEGVPGKIYLNQSKMYFSPN